MKRRGISFLGLGLFLLGLASVPGLGAQEAESQSPLTENDIYRLLQSEVSSEDVAAMVRARGIAFEVTPRFEENLGLLKAKPILLEAVKAPARLELRANAVGAEVQVDGEGRGTLPAEGPLVVEPLVAGNHVVRISSPDYVTKTETVFLKPGETRPLELELAGAVSMMAGPLGTRVNVQAGTRPDALLNEIDSTSDSAQKAQLIRQMIESSPDSPLVLMGYRMLQQIYLADNQHDQALGAGEELLQRDPRNFSGRAGQARAALGKGDLAGALNHTQRLVQVLEEAQTLPAPEGRDASAWENEKKQAFQEAEQQMRALDYELFLAVSQAGDASSLERFLELLPKSAYRKHAYASVTLAYQRQGNLAKMLEWSGRALEDDPDQAAVLVVVADALSESPEDADRAEQHATHLLSLLTNESEKARIPGISDEQWATQKQFYEGIAHTALGMINFNRGNFDAAIPEFQAAAPFLENQPFYHARNLFRLAVCYARMGGRKNLQVAQTMLDEVIGLNSPFTPAAQDMLQRVKQTLGVK